MEMSPPLLDSASASAQRQAFQQLKPICTQLLQLRASPPQLHAELLALSEALRALPTEGLALCWDYVAFPLYLMADSAAMVHASQGPAEASSRRPAAPAEPASTAAGDAGSVAVPAVSSLRVCEALVAALQALVAGAPWQETDQLLALLQRLSPLLQLPRAGTSEELRAGAFDIVQAALARIPAHPRGSEASQQLTKPAMAGLLGYIVHCCLEASEAELLAREAAGGSKRVRAAALSTLRTLLQAVRSADAWSFFLPGVASSLAKQLAAASLAPAASAAGGSGSAASIHALGALVDMVMLTLGDAAVADIPGLGASNGSRPHANGDGRSATAAAAGDSSSADGALAALRRLAISAHGASSSSSSSQQPPFSASSDQGTSQQAAEPRSKQAQPVAPEAPGHVKRLRVSRTADWVRSSADRVAGLLDKALPPLCHHARPAVRQALAEAVITLLGGCRAALKHSSQNLLQLLFTLAQDDFPSLSQPCIDYMTTAQISAPPSASPSAAPAAAAAGLRLAAAPDADRSSASSDAALQLMTQLADGLFAAVRSGQDAGTAHAKQLVTAMLYAGAQGCAGALLLQPASLCQQLTKCFTFDRNSARLMLYAKAEGGEVVAAATAEPAASSPQGGPAPPGAGAPLPGAAQPPTAPKVPSPPAVAVLLPRMPLGLAYMASKRVYEAVAAVARTAGHLARVADVGSAAAHSTCLRRLLDQLQAQHGAAAAAGYAGGAAPAGPAADSWQCSAAAAAVVMSEVVFGASAEWHPRFSCSADQPHLGAKLKPDAGYESAVLSLLGELTQERVWRLPTHVDFTPSAVDQSDSHAPGSAHATRLLLPDPSHEAPGGAAAVGAQALGENVLLLRTSLEVIGAAARSLGRRFVANSRLLRAVLFPILERLGDPSPAVASAAGNAIGSICVHCGHASMSDLLSANADFVVDGVCRQLRDLGRHPRAPQLLAALLAKAGGAPQLLPLLAEPLRAAFQGLSIVARRTQPGYTHCFLAALNEVVRGSQQEGAVVDEWSGAHADRIKALAAEVEAAEEAKAEAAASAHSSTAAGSAQEGEGSEDASAAEYFMLRAERRKALAGRPGGVDISEEVDPSAAASDDDGFREQRVLLTGADMDELDERFRRLHSAAVLAESAADAAAPLAASEDLRSALTALAVLQGALATLQRTTAALERDDAVRDECGSKDADRLKPPRPQTPKLLVSVASTWPLLMAALRDRRLPVAERACAVLAVVVKLAGGQFLARRVHTEAWPLLAKLLTTGSAASTLQTKSLLVQERLNGAGGTPLAALEDEHMAPAAVQRAQLAALACLAVMCSDAEAAKAVKSLAWPIASAALPFLGRSASAALHEAACSLLLALAGVDADAVWLLLHDVVASGSSASGAAKRKPGAAGSLPLQPTSSPQAAGAAVLQPAERLLPPLPAAAGRPGLRVSSSSSPRGAWPVTPELAAECAARAAPLLERVNSLPSVWCTWHKR